MRTNVYLAIVAAILAVPTWLTIRAESGSFTRYEDVPRLFEGFSPDRVAAIVMTKHKLDEHGQPIKAQNGQPELEVLRLQKGPEGWMIAQGEIAGAPVRSDPDVVAENVLQHVESIRRDEDALVATDADAETLGTYDLSDEKGLLIQCFDATNRAVAELVMGRNAREATAGANALRGFFVRRKDYQDVILYERDFWNVSLDPNQWIERNVIPRTAAGQVVELEIQNERGTVAFQKGAASDVEWQVAKGPEGVGAVRHQEVDSRASRIARASIMDYVRVMPPDEARKQQYLQPFGLAEPKLSARIKLEDGSEYVIGVGDKLPDQNQYHATFSNSKFHVTVADWVYTSFDFAPEELFDPSPDSIKDDGTAQPKDGDDVAPATPDKPTPDKQTPDKPKKDGE